MAPAEICNPPVPIPETLWHAFTAAVARQPQETAVTVYFQPANHLQYLRLDHDSVRNDSHLKWSFEDLKHATVQVAAGMLQRGVRRGSTVVTFLPNCIEREIITWVSMALQCTLMPLDPALFDPGRKDELEYYLASVTPHIVVVENEQATSAWDKLSTNAESLKVTLEANSNSSWISLSSLPATHIDPAAAENLVAQQDLELEDHNERIASIVYTSGTSSGRPKGCAVAARQILTLITVGSGWDSRVKSMVIYSANFRSMSNWMAWISILTNVKIVMPSQQLNIARLLDAFEESDGGILMPFMLHVFLQDEKFAKGERDLSGVKGIILGGDVITVDLIERGKRIFPNASVRGSHGMSESIGCLTAVKHGDSTVQPTLGAIVAAGTANGGSCVRICDEDGKVLQRGELGELHYGGQSVMKRYWQNEQPELFYTDEKASWMITGDRALMDDDGSIFVVGRSKNIIKRKGLSLSPAVLTSVMNRRPGILATVFGIPDEINGEAIVAVIESSDPSNTPEAIKEFVVESLGVDYAIDELYTLQDLGMQQFPLGPTGKILNSTLKEAVLKLTS